MKQEIYKLAVSKLPTVGKKRAWYLNQLGIFSVEDLLLYSPREIQDRRSFDKMLDYSLLNEGQKITVIGKILTYSIIVAKKKLGILKLAIETIQQPSRVLVLIWYKKLQSRYDVFSTLKKQIEHQENNHKYIIAYGKVVNTKSRLIEINVEDYEVFTDLKQYSIHTNKLVPVYSLNEHLSQQWFRELVYRTLESYKLDEFLPKKILNAERLLDINTAIKNLHFPETWQMYNEAKKRLLFEKFLFLQIAVLKVKKNIISKPKIGKYKIKRSLLTPFKERLKVLIPDFEFTHAQKRVINELFRDMLSSKPMNRLLIGDVGSGKTVVAVSCALLAVENGYQVAFMAPTEILAEQHYYNLSSYVKGLFNPEKSCEVKIEILTGKMSKKQKEKVLQDIESGKVDIVVGTHALIEERVKFKNLSLVIIDEQHRFGVLQRKKLYEKSTLTDVLVMTATPIPRSLAMTLYGELDISVIDEVPSGRIPVKTFFYNIENYDYSLVLERLHCGEKVYIVYPIIEETKLEIKTLVEEFKILSTTVFKKFSCALLHGKMKSKEKQEVMRKFRDGEYQVLFSTTVIEVGIDVPDATVIVINHAERFGLAQLHQLRGRVGRGQKQSYCILLGQPNTEESKRRIEIMLSTTDGFKIANEDLLLRGPGQIFGTLQHGKSEFDFSDILTNSHLLSTAKKYAKSIIFDNEFKNEDLTLLFKKVYFRYAKDFGLASVG